MWPLLVPALNICTVMKSSFERLPTSSQAKLNLNTIYKGSLIKFQLFSCAQVFTTTPTVTRRTSIMPCWQWATAWPPRGRSTGSSRTGGTHHLSEWLQVVQKSAMMIRRVVCCCTVDLMPIVEVRWHEMLRDSWFPSVSLMFVYPLTAGARPGATRATSWWHATVATSAASPAWPATPSCEEMSVELRGRKGKTKRLHFDYYTQNIHLEMCAHPFQNLSTHYKKWLCADSLKCKHTFELSE